MDETQAIVEMPVLGSRGRRTSAVTKGNRAPTNDLRMPRPPLDPGAAILTFLAPAERCNQKCPSCYLTEVSGEPVSVFALRPADYAEFIEQFVEAGVPVLTVNFQGYEVTLPQSWPYVEAAFAVANRRGLRKSFITNGMLLYKYAERIDTLDPSSISISLDGGDATTNDRLRGLPGAFDATLTSLRRFLDAVPDYADYLKVCSCLYDEENVESLVTMPKVLRTLGITRWRLAYELTAVDERSKAAQPREVIVGWIARLQAAAEVEGVHCEVHDAVNFFTEEDERRIRLIRIPSFDFLYRMDPLGYVRTGLEVYRSWQRHPGVRWRPGAISAVEAVGHWERVERSRVTDKTAATR